MEVDLLCDDARIAVELDGPQHFTGAPAYRRDRRKEQLLQEYGYLVLRFINEDVTGDLDLVLDSILRALAMRARNHSGVSLIETTRDSRECTE
jgi:very-short-patch-repair endonuclease